MNNWIKTVFDDANPHNNDYIAVRIYCSMALHVTVSILNQASIKISNKYEA